MDNIFKFDNTSFSVSVEQIYTHQFSNDIKFKLTFYNSLIKIDEFIIKNIYDMVKLIFNIKEYIETYNQNDYFSFNTTLNDKGNYYTILIQYKEIQDDNPYEEDILTFSIYKTNIYRQVSQIIISFNISDYILEDFIIFLYTYISSNNYDITQIMKSMLLDIYKGVM